MKSTRALIKLLRADGSTTAVEAADRLELLYRETGGMPEQMACAEMLWTCRTAATETPAVPLAAMGFGTRSMWLQRAAEHLAES